MNTFVISFWKLDDVHILESCPSVKNWSNGELISKEIDDVAMEAVDMMEATWTNVKSSTDVNGVLMEHITQFCSSVPSLHSITQLHLASVLTHCPSLHLYRPSGQTMTASPGSILQWY